MKMKINFRAAALSLMLLSAAVLSVSCGMNAGETGGANTEEPDGVVVTEATTEFQEHSMEADENAVPASGAKPLLSASNVTCKAGETAEISISVSGADKKWAMCGVHVTYDETIVCEPSSSDPKDPVFKRGDAVNNISGFVTKLQTGEDRNDYLAEKKLNSVFFAAVDSDNNGADGDIVTYNFKVPGDAKSGTVYEIGFYYREGDMFLDKDQDKAVQDYAFSHWQSGSITVE